MGPRGYTALPVSHANTQAHPTSSALDIFLFLAHRPKGVFTTVLAFVLVAIVIIKGGETRPGLAREVRGELELPLSPLDSWTTLVESSGARGWRPLPSDAIPAAVPASKRSLLSAECGEALVAKGELCRALEDAYDKDAATFDVLLPWTNGSDRLLRTWREDLSSMRPRKLRKRVPPAPGFRGRPLGDGRPIKGDTKRHYRQHDELRFALRSLLASFPVDAIRAIFLVTADLPAHVLPTATASHDASTLAEFPENVTVVGQIPTWLDLESLKSATPPLRLVHHSEFFHQSRRPLTIKDWIRGPVPSFNSLAIEAQLPNIPALGDLIFYSNDDVFFTAPLSSTDVGSPLTGPVFRIQRDLLVDAVEPGGIAGDPEGEWPGLKHANYLLDQRFGKRKRGYLAHIAKSLPTSIWREARQLWDSELTKTSTSRFRGQRDEIQSPFLVTHYTIERHREALLWSFFVARSDANHDGRLDLTERAAMLDELGFIGSGTAAAEQVDVVVPRRATLSGQDEMLQQAGLPKARATETVFTSQDGFSMFFPSFVESDPGRRGEWPVRPSSGAEEQACVLERLRCFGPEREQSTDSFFRRVAFEEPSCGDCAIALLVNLSGPRGLSAFLPPLVSPLPTSSQVTVEDTPLDDLSSTSFSSVKFSRGSGSRSRSTALIHRYRYTIGSTPTRFISMRQTPLVISALSSLSPAYAKQYGHPQQPPDSRSAIVTLNDDLLSAQTSLRVDAALAKFFRVQWPICSPYEHPP